MNARHAIRKMLACVPASWGAALGICAFVAAGLLLSRLSPPLRDPEAETEACAKQCAPRLGQLARDMDYPMSGKGQHRLICKCQ